MEFDYTRVSRFETPASIIRAGSWLAAQGWETVLGTFSTAFASTTEEHVFPLLCVLDVVLKFSEQVKDAVAPHVHVWIQVVPKQSDAVMAKRCEDLLMFWMSCGVVAPTRFSFVRQDNEGEHRCPVCRRLFMESKRRDEHLDTHFKGRMHALVQRQRQNETLALGVFASIRDRKRIQHEAKQRRPTRAASPIPVQLNSGSSICSVCGDPLNKSYCDIVDAVAWHGCVVNCHGHVVHDECDNYIFPYRQVKRACLPK